jgi:fluoride exporter
MTWLAVALGGALGSMARHWINLELAHHFERSVPYATAAVNLIGALAIGVLAGAIATGQVAMSPLLRTFVFVGLLGGFTTFSSFMLDTFTLAHGGDLPLASSNFVLQNVAGAALTWGGYHAAGWLR